MSYVYYKMVKYPNEVIETLSKIIEDLEYTQSEIEESNENERRHLIEVNYGHTIRNIVLNMSICINGFLMTALILYTKRMTSTCV